MEQDPELQTWSRHLNEIGRPATPDDQSRTFDGRVLNTRESVLEFLREVDIARREGRTLGPPSSNVRAGVLEDLGPPEPLF